MEKMRVNNLKELEVAISQLEQEVEQKAVIMRLNFIDVKEALSPGNVVKNTFANISAQPGYKRVLINTTIGFVLGFATKKALDILSRRTLTGMLQRMSKLTLDRIEKKNPEGLLTKGIMLFRRFTPSNSFIYPFIRYKK